MELQVGVKILLQNKQGEYLFLRRTAESGSEVDKYWDMPGGRINPGSTLFENLQREVLEETGLTLIAEPKIIAAQDILRPHKHIVRITYLGSAEGEVVLSSEHSEYKWLTLEEVRKLEPLDKFFKEILAKYL